MRVATLTTSAFFAMQLISTAEDIAITTRSTALVVRINDGQNPRIVHFGKRLAHQEEYAKLPDQPRSTEDYTGLYNSAYTPAGSRNLLEPAIQAIHADGNPSLDLRYVSHESIQGPDTITTEIHLKDPAYPFQVTLFYKAYQDEDLIEQWSVIHHDEPSSVKLEKYASANLTISAANYYLTQFHGDWAKEMQPQESKLTAGIKVLDSKLGTRADLFQPPSFLISLNQPAAEDTGEVIAGTLAWTGNFKMDFEVDPLGELRLIAGINPYASEYVLDPGVDFKTPSFIYTYSSEGKGLASRNLHQWARKHRIPHGEGNRLTLLNNWEATYFDFDEKKLEDLFADGKKLGVDLFLLDDGWFGNKYPRNGDNAGLGDWQENQKKIPNGIGNLIQKSAEAGIKFGIWIEPEMVNPKSELFENHPDWVVMLPNRVPYYFRNQLVLDLSNPEVRKFVHDTVDQLLTEHPDIAYIKWDCNAVIYNAWSPTLKHQGNFYVDFVNGFYEITSDLRKKHPDIPMMLCSGGGGRVDYGALNDFTEFWPSDNTDALERVFLQWNYSYFFPSIATCAHITEWGKQPLKYRTDVAMMGKLGYDIVVSEMSPDDLKFSQEALATYAKIKDVIWHGDLYRLASPYENDFASLSYVSPGKDRAIWFNYLVNNRYQKGSDRAIKLKGLNPEATYQITEINLYPGKSSALDPSANQFSGDYLMTVGYNPKVNADRSSVILQLEAAK
ncbi:alpha-galactosidase [Luteolibacter pohnpeiensis]|uniref:Alpha-galactosidase n=1 Tax=Luteolibacter pohnpeiensis TaxID=454153 RepID=A0A934VT36_9BACT|nr:alpha-galactosidase [Luteolibacter pohnpeiensis]MBK1881077.1 alpha-galactosidase [Luteolibacter pohnpeiensis]